MAYESVKNQIDAYIKANGVNLITGPVLNAVLTTMLDELGEGYAFQGVLNTTDTPSPAADIPQAWLASAGTYLGGSITVDEGELALIIHTADGWIKETVYRGVQLSHDAIVDALGYTPADDADLAEKQDTIADLSAIRSGAALGDTSVQPADIEDMVEAEPIGSIIPPVNPSEFATKEGLSQLEAKVDDLDIYVKGGDAADSDITPTTTTGYYFSNRGTTITIFSNAGSKYSGTVVNTSTPPSDGIDVSGYIGKTIKVTVASRSSTSSRQTLIAKADMTWLVGYAEETFTQDDGETTYSREFVVPAEAKWLFFSSTGNLVSIIVKGAGHIDGLEDRVEDLEAEIPTISGNVSAIKEKTDILRIAHSANLFNKNDADVVLGKFLTGNTFYTDANYNVSGYIPVNPSTTYYGATGTQPFRFAEYYKADKTYISGDNLPNGSQFTTPASCAYVRVTLYADRYATAQVAETNTAYVAYSVFLETTQGTSENAIATLKDVNGDNGDVLFGKKWVACGDSFTHGDFTNAPEDDYHIEDGLYQGQLKVYPFIIGNRTKMVVVNEAVNGSTMTYVGGNRSEFSTPNGRYTQIPADADYITLKFGINDDTAHASAPIGTIDDNTNTTFYGAWNIVMDYLIRNHPQAKIGIIVTNGSQLPYVNAIIAIAEKWGVSYLNEATDPKCSFMFRSNRTDVVASIRDFRNSQWYVDADTNNHPNADAHEFESTVIEAWLRTL